MLSYRIWKKNFQIFECRSIYISACMYLFEFYKHNELILLKLYNSVSYLFDIKCVLIKLK